ncbi:MAG: 5-oxoprolinase subunit PxpB [Negativicutes bacterium]|nr:5-oxoprolinase subunit PxpB [Negativicutes bacterium]
MDSIRLLNAGEQGLVVEFGREINAELNKKVHRLARKLAAQTIAGITEVVPTYRSLLVYFDPLKISRACLADRIEQLLAAQEAQLPEQGEAIGNLVRIPVCYGGEFGPDLEFVAQHNGLTVEEVIRIHTATPYQVYMLGFTPGFPYLGGMSEKIAAPRLEKPRLKIPAGSVGIAGSQTGFYPIESPGGWRLIGRTPIKAFHPESPNPFMFAAGDFLQFTSVAADEFYAIQRRVDNGTYIPEITSLPRG